jgi:hypothetical protein
VNKLQEAQLTMVRRHQNSEGFCCCCTMPWPCDVARLTPEMFRTKEKP